jgi:hypothetical protein
MNNALTMEECGLAPHDVKPLEGVLTFLASRSKRSARELSVSAGEVFNGVSGVVDQLLISVIEKRTAAEFVAAFTDVFPKYFAMTTALSNFAQVIVPPEVIERLTRESICELEADFREKALLSFGTAVRDQAMFTVWTLRKINDLVNQIAAAKLDKSKRDEDREYSRNFNFYALRAHFSLDCLNMALRLDRPIYPEVMEELVDGLRSMVNAYAWARRGVAIRVPTIEEAVGPAVSDAEDDYLLSASMQDMAAMDDDENALNGD